MVLCFHVEIETSLSLTAMIHPDALDFEASWDSVLFIRNPFLRMIKRPRTLEMLASEIFEGQRTLSNSKQKHPEFGYRASSISRFELNPSRQQWTAPATSGQLAIQPGDVVVKRLAPVMAAVVP